MERTKELYKRLPKSKEDVFNYRINWNALYKFDVIEKVARPWIGKKLKEYVGEEEYSFIQLVIKKLNSKCSPEDVKKIASGFLDKESEEFVMKLW